MKSSFTRSAGLAMSLSLIMWGCNAFGVFGDEDGNEVRVTVTAVAADNLTADDGHTYQVNSKTEFEGLSGLGDVTVGDTVEIEWEAISGSSNRLALEIEAGDHDDSGDDD